VLRFLYRNGTSSLGSGTRTPGRQLHRKPHAAPAVPESVVHDLLGKPVSTFFRVMHGPAA